MTTATLPPSASSPLPLLLPHTRLHALQVSVVTVENGTAVVRYKGPPAIGKGVTAAIRDKFPDIKEVVLIDY